MKLKGLILALVLLSFTANYAQKKTDYPTNKGRWLLEANTGFGKISPANTGFMLNISNSQVSWNIGAEAGYFITKRLAIKFGLGFGNLATGPSSTGGEGGSEGTGGGEGAEGGTGAGEAGEGGSASVVGGSGGSSIAGLGSILSYKIGAKYYFQDVIPVQIDFSGTSVSNYNHEVGFQLGYAFYFGEDKNVSIEPGVRYSIPLKTKLGTFDDQFQMNIGFALHF